MQKELLIAVLGGLGGMLGWGFSEFSTKKAVDKLGFIACLVWAHVFGTIILFFILFSNIFFTKNPNILPTHPLEWLGLIFFGTLQTVVYFYGYKGFEKGQVSILSPIFASFTALVALLSVLVFGEALKFNLIPALILIFGGVLLLNIDPKSMKSNKFHIAGTPGLKEIVIATILATIWTLGWDKFIESKDWILYTSLMFAFMSISAYLISRFHKIDLKKVKLKEWKFLWFIAIGEVVAYLAISLGYSSTAYTSIVAVLSGASSLPTIILARIFLKEKVSTIQTIGSLIVVGGIILISVS